MEDDDLPPVPQKPTIIPNQIFQVPKLDIAKVTSKREPKPEAKVPEPQPVELKLESLTEASIFTHFLSESISHNLKGSKSDLIEFDHRSHKIRITLSKQAKVIEIMTQGDTM